MTIQCAARPRWFLVLAAFFVLARAGTGGPPASLRVADFGATGRGDRLETAALQKAIDAAAAAGGGTVYFPPGVYLSGSLLLKDRVRLYLEAGSVLKGSTRIEDYAPIPRKNRKGGKAFKEGVLLYAEGARDVAIEGRGVIEGQGQAFWFPEKINHFVRKPMPRRPPALVCFVKCQGLLVRDVRLVNSPCYTLWLIGCDNARIDGITILNPRDGPNTDGIDIDCSSRVRVAGCLIDGGDDAIALKSDSGLLGEDKACEDITVSNCVPSSVPACAVRIGYEGDAPIRNCSFSNLAIHDSDVGLDIISILPDRPELTIAQGTRCENLVFDNITMREVNKALFFWMGNETKAPARVALENVQVSNLTAHARLGSFIGGYDRKSMRNVRLSNIHLTCTAAMPEQATLAGSNIWAGTWNPYALFCTHVEGLRIDNLDVDLSQAQGHWRHVLWCDQVRDVDIRGLSARGFAALPGISLIGLNQSRAAIRDCAVEQGLPLFLKAGAGSRAFVSGCDLEGAKKDWVRDASAEIVEGSISRQR